MLYIFNKSPLRTRDLEQCVSLKKSKDSKVLLIEDAVIGVKKGIATEYLIEKLQSDGITVYALQADLKARGIENIAENIAVIDYEGFVDLVVENKFVSCL
jgi:tRNA 2-thiouridine synthesizing protein B